MRQIRIETTYHNAISMLSRAMEWFLREIIENILEMTLKTGMHNEISRLAYKERYLGGKMMGK